MTTHRRTHASSPTAEYRARVRVSHGAKAMIELIEGDTKAVDQLPEALRTQYEAENGLLVDIRRKLGTVVCGDYVLCELSEQSAVISHVEPRQTALARPDRRRRLKPIAANIDQLVVVSAHKPGLDFSLIDSYLVSAQQMGMRAMLIFNKSDIEHNQEKLNDKIKYYQSLGVHSLSISLYKKTGLDDLDKALNNTTSLFVGQSGVGKSSLINHLIPDQSVQVGALSDATGLGSHTTTTTILYHLPAGGDLIDSPGVREFATWQFTPEQIAQGFVEFAERAHLCKFNNCLHNKEPQCAVKAALESGEIAPWRYEHYQTMLNNSDHEAILP